MAAGRLEIPLLYKFSCYKQATFEKIKTFIQTLYDHKFVVTVAENNSGEEDQMTIGIVSDLHPQCDQLLAGYSDIFGTVTEEDSSGIENEMEILASESQPPYARHNL